MARGKRSRRRSPSRRMFHRRGRGSHSNGIIPTMMGVGAAMAPLTNADPGAGGVPPLEGILGALQNNDWKGATFYVGRIGPNVISQLLPIAELGAGAAILSFAAKKTGLRNATRVSKKWSIF